MRSGAVFLALVALACTRAASTPSSLDPSTTTTTIPTTTTTSLPVCEPAAVDMGDVDAADAHEISIAFATAVWTCANEVVVASPGEDAIATAVGVQVDGPVLVDGPRIEDELARLGARAVTWVGPSPAPAWATTTVPPDPAATIPPSDGAPVATWVVDGDATTLATARALGAVDPIDVSSLDDVTRADVATLERIRGATTLVTVGLDADRRGQLDRARLAQELPGGGLTFDGTRLVAFYGNPTTPFLGVLGEQGPAATLERILPIAAEYEADGIRSIPTFEIIATVASSRAGADGDYSDEASVDLLRPWVEFAGENDMYVMLDLQPGRTDFLTQARRYEELLRLPHVGLALDPEWRLEPDQVHLRQIGSVDAAEINQVSRWLTEIVRDERLPQKYFLVHQFRFSMITNREKIETPPELFTVIQMDGQGPLSTKYDTYAAITEGQEGAGWAWGWKNFYDEDSPTATPAQVLAVEPTPVFVSYQ